MPHRLRAAVRLAVALSVVVSTLAACTAGTPKPHPTGTPTAPPAADPFYSAPAHLGKLHHGALIRTRRAVISSNGISSLAAARTILFASTDIHGRPIAASATVLTPFHSWIGNGARPIIALQPAYDSLGSQCEPSYALQVNPMLETTTLNELKQVLPTGAEIVIPDYEGPDALFGIGDQAGRIVLDAIRAAEQTGLGGINQATKVTGFGYSGGGLATAWTAELAPSYAPRLNFVGVAEGGVPADIKESLSLLDGGKYAVLAVMTLVAIDRAYPGAGIGTALNAVGHALFRRIGSTCATAGAVAAVAGRSVNTITTAPNLLQRAKLQPIFGALRLGQRAPTMPIYNFQGTADQIVGFAPDQALVKKYCSEGVTVDFVPIKGANHTTAFIDGAAGVAQWLEDRLNGKPAAGNCASA